VVAGFGVKSNIRKGKKSLKKIWLNGNGFLPLHPATKVTQFFKK